MADSMYPRGSEWRRWDLHVHTPSSALNASFGTWDEYVGALEKSGANVAALGITDYCSVEGYKKILEYRKQGRLAQFSLVIPNIEFRVTPELPGGKGINIHLLISPEDPQHVTRIEQALGKLTFSFKGNPYSCRTDELIALGRAKDPSATEDTAAFKVGVNAFKPSFDALRNWYTENDWLQKNALIVIANGKDGASGLSKDSGFSAVRDELYRFSDLVFSGNPSDREYFLGEGSDSVPQLVEDKGGPKACIHGSDAHDDSRLFAPNLDRFCWIKADPTFEGLRQLLHEPEDRVYIGPTPPSAHDKSRIIDEVEFGSAAKWFKDKQLLLNPGLVAVIGEKGSGKTALADVIAFACGAWNAEESSTSFITKARDYLDGVTVTVKWADGHASHGRLDRDPPADGPFVRYLSQDFVEQLCSQDFKGERLIAEVENVVFAYIDEADRLDASSFEELRRTKTAYLDARRSDIRAKLSKSNDEIVRLEDEIAQRPKKLAAIKQHEDAIEAIDKQLPELQKASDQEVIEKLQTEKGILAERTAELTELNKRASLADTAHSRATDFYADLDEQYEELASTLSDLGLTEEEVRAFRPTVAGKPLKIIEKLKTSLEADAKRLRGEPDKPTAKGTSIADIQARIQKLEKDVATDTKIRERLLELQKQRMKLDTELGRLKKEVERIDSVLARRLETKRADRWRTYLSYFDVLVTERKELERLYEPLARVIAEDSSGSKSGFDLNVKQTADGSSWLDSGIDMLDQRRKGAVIRSRDFVRGLEKSLFAAWRVGDKDAIRAELEKVISSLDANGPEVDKLLVSHATRTKLYDWLFSPEHVRLDYGLTFQDTDLDALSPGARGIVLLVLYLAMDQNDRRPLIIDQPEGNLDNSSIYESLVPFLRQAKKLRQVILITHNPNLVATTDADQVIVASSSKEAGAEHAVISYHCGSLEHADEVSGTRDRAVRLLEGGKRPFKIREGRWRIAALAQDKAIG